MEFPIRHKDLLIVEADRGEDIGMAILNCHKQSYTENNDLPKILRKASQNEILRMKENRLKEKQAFYFCKEKIPELKMQMNLVDVECRLDRKKITFYFTANGRIDFRELVKILAAEYKTRIEMRQISTREESKRADGVGMCGLHLCCSRFIDDFEPVSTQLVKDQNLPMNPAKISGYCGKLKCCFRYEYDSYQTILQEYPEYGTAIKTKDKQAVLEKIDIFQETVTLRYDEEHTEDMSLAEFKKIYAQQKKES